MALNNTDNSNQATFTARIVDTPNISASSGSYQTTDWRRLVNRRTNESDWRKYYEDWFQFSGNLTSMVINGQEYEIPPNLRINICIASKQDGRYNEKLNKYILLTIRLYSNIRFRGEPRRLDLSEGIQVVEPTDIENADEIYVSENCIDTIKAEFPDKETLNNQSQYRRPKTRVNYWQKLERVVKRTFGKISKYVKQHILSIIGIIIAFFALVVAIKQGGC